MPQNDDPALLTAWQSFLIYDNVSKKMKRHRTMIRQWIIVLGLLTSFIAVVITYGNEDAHGQLQHLVYQYLIPLRVILAALPILTALLVAYASEWAPAISWAVYRVVGELIRREIYLYRMKAGAYGGEEQERRITLLTNLGKATRLEKIYETDGMDHSAIREAAEQVLSGSAGVPKYEQILATIEHDGALIGEIGSITSKRFERSTEPTMAIKFAALQESVRRRLRREREANSPSSSPSPLDDNGFCALSPEDYVSLRLAPQLNWYINRANWDYRYLRNWKVFILAMGGFGSFLVAVSAIYNNVHLEPLVAVTTAIAAALALYLELRMYNHTYLIYNSAVNRLQELLREWNVMLKNAAVDPNQALTKQFVVRTERILQAEREEWMLRVIQSQTALEQKLARSGGQGDASGGQNGSGTGPGSSLLRRASALYYRKDLPPAKMLYEESLKLFHQSSDLSGQLEAIEGLAMVHAALAEPPQAAPLPHIQEAGLLAGAAGANRSQCGKNKAPDSAAYYDGLLTTFRARLSADELAAFENAFQEGEKLTLEDVMNRVENP